MAALKKRPYKDELDLEAIAELLNACELVDRLSKWKSVSQLRLEFGTPSADTSKNILLWENTNGDLMGLSQILISPTDENDGLLELSVHPEARGKDLERQMIAWGEQRMRQIAAEKGVTVKLRSGVRECLSERIDLLKNCGFSIE
ncbi:MAG: hypothetical protein RLZZ381_4034, partial [Cyanobacteriota bacterium]